MYISYNWLQDFIKIPSKINFQNIADKLTAHTVEIENVISQTEVFKNVVVGKVLEVNKHPGADKLNLALVDIGKDKLKIVCGAQNLKTNQFVPVALVGAILPNGLEIKQSIIRGESSDGMICAEDELGLGDDHEGIMILHKKTKPGENFADYLKLNDIVFEVDNKSLSNRPDLLSHYGLARELSAILETKLKPYSKIIGSYLNLFNDNKIKELSISIENKNAILRYSAIKIENIKIEESPEWLKNRLISVNQKPINNIVDLTNYVMLECGQPMHAFDARKIKKIGVRLAEKNENFVTIDNQNRNLLENDIVITNGQETIALAGIMGGKNSEVTENTTSFILESATFNAEYIRRTAQRLGLRTEASTRFEKSLDPELTIEAIYRFLSLLKEISPDFKINSKIFDFYPHEFTEKNITLDLDWLKNKIGQEISQDKIVSILSHLGFRLAKSTQKLEVTIPSWRATKDIKEKEDLAEEILRVYGYDQIKAALPVEQLNIPETNHELMIERKIKNILALKFGLFETYNYSFVSEDYLTKLDIDFFNHLKLANPLSETHNLLRQSLIPGLINNIKNNQANGEGFGFFEIGYTFFNAPGEFNKDKDEQSKLPYQEKKLALAITGKNIDLFSKIKDILTSFCREIIGQNVEIIFSSAENYPGWSQPEICAKFFVNQEDLGYLGLIKTETIKKLNIKTQVALLEISLPTLYKIIKNHPLISFFEPPKYPAVIRDVCFVVSQKVMYNDIKKELTTFNPLLKSVELIDVYIGNKLDKDEKSLTFRLYYQADDRTLISSEVDGIQNNLLEKLSERFQAKLRNF